MDDTDDEPPRKSYPLAPSKMSKTPSWVMLGFVLGAAFVAALPPLGERKITATLEPGPRPAPAAPAAPREAQPLATIEAVFAAWGEHAVWWDDVTEVALWNSATKEFSDYYEVRRFGRTNYFRSIPTLTRRLLTHGKVYPDSPLQFTETEEQYQEWRQHGRVERPPERDYRPLPPRPQPAAAPRVPTVEAVPPPRAPALATPAPPLGSPSG
jgi:hypothetical protein